MRGDERTSAPIASAPIKMDPFNEVRSPARNFGPAKLASGAFTTPLARRLASERGIDLTRISGSGPRGRVVASDVENSAPAAAPMAGGASAAQVKALYEGVAYEEVPLDGMRATIARRLVDAKQTIPHFYLTGDIDIGRLVAMREEANAAAPPLPNPPPQAGEGRVGRRRSSFRSTILSSKRGRRRCNAFPPPTRCGRRTGSCVSRIPTLASRWRSKVA